MRGLAFEARAGDFIAVLGRNGVGKTLTLHTLAGLKPAAAGRVMLDGRDIAAWSQSIGQMRALDPAIVVAGHARPGLPDDASGLAFTADYLAQWPQLVSASTDSVDLRARVQAAFPTTVDVLDDFILKNSAEVAMGEQPIWTE